MNENTKRKLFNFFESLPNGKVFKYEGYIIKETDIHFIIYDVVKNKEFYLIKRNTSLGEIDND